MTTDADTLRRVAAAGIGAGRVFEPEAALLLCWAGVAAGDIERHVLRERFSADGLPKAWTRPGLLKRGRVIGG